MSDDLRNLLHDAVADVDPADRLGTIRQRTAGRPKRARWPLVVLGAGVATAAVVVAMAVGGGLGRSDDAPPTDGDPRQRAVALYFTGDTAAGPRLFREFQPGTPEENPDDATLAALQRLEADSGPRDPDYRTPWPDGSFTDVTIGDDWILVEVGTAALTSVGDLPAAERELALQQVVHTAEGATATLLPVTFSHQRMALPELLGIPVPDLVERASDVSAPVNLSNPTEGLVVDGKGVAVDGVVSPGQTTTSVEYAVRDASGKVVDSGSLDVTELEFDGTVKVGDLPAGDYEISVRLPAGAGSDPGDPGDTDTRTISIR